MCSLSSANRSKQPKSQQTNVGSALPPSPPRLEPQQRQRVHWGADVDDRFVSSNPNEAAMKHRLDRRQRRRQPALDRLQAKIHKAAAVELALLNKAKELRLKRGALMAEYLRLARAETAKMPPLLIDDNGLQILNPVDD